jgi:hypothetical protein
MLRAAEIKDGTEGRKSREDGWLDKTKLFLSRGFQSLFGSLVLRFGVHKLLQYGNNDTECQCLY